MARRDNPVLGTINCDGCGGTASVHQAKRGSGRFLYTRCGECGADQRTGKSVQTRLFNQTEWRTGADPVKPPNVLESSVPELETTDIEQICSHEHTDEQPRTTETQPSKAGKLAPFAFLGLIAAGFLAFAK